MHPTKTKNKNWHSLLTNPQQSTEESQQNWRLTGDMVEQVGKETCVAGAGTATLVLSWIIKTYASRRSKWFRIDLALHCRGAWNWGSTVLLLESCSVNATHSSYRPACKKAKWHSVHCTHAQTVPLLITHTQIHLHVSICTPTHIHTYTITLTHHDVISVSVSPHLFFTSARTRLVTRPQEIPTMNIMPMTVKRIAIK